MRSIIALLVVIVSGCAGGASEVRWRNPIYVAGSPGCLSGQRETFWQAVACHRVWVSQDVPRPGIWGGAFATELAEDGVSVLDQRPSSSRDFVEVRATALSNGFGQTLRARVEIRDPDGRLLAFGEQVVGDAFVLPEAFQNINNRLCVIRSWPCGG